MSQRVNTTQGAYIAFHRFTLSANGGEKPLAVTGVYFMVAEQKGAAGLKFEASIDGGPFFPVTIGLKFALPDGNQFGNLRFRNPTSEDITAEVYAGSIESEDMRLNIVRGRSAPVMDAETVVTSNGATIPASGEIDLAGTVPISGYMRRAIIVTNMDPAVDLDVTDQGDNVLDAVFYRQSKLYETSADLKVKNNTAAPVVCRIMQVWYVIV